MNKKGVFNLGVLQALGSAALLIVFLGLIIGYGGQINEDIQSDATAGGSLYNSTVDTGEALTNMSEKMPTLSSIIMLVAILALLAGLLVIGFMRMRG